jgi:transcriptional regulator with XRE-family HTH domain
VKAPTITDEDRLIANNIALVKDHRGFTNDDIAQKMGRTRNWVQERTSGAKRLYYGELVEFSRALEVPVRVLGGNVTNVLRYLMEHPDLVANRLSCMLFLAGQETRTLCNA